MDRFNHSSCCIVPLYWWHPELHPATWVVVHLNFQFYKAKLDVETGSVLLAKQQIVNKTIKGYLAEKKCRYANHVEANLHL